MEISEGCFFLFWAMISAIFLKLGFNTIENTELSNSVPPIVMFLFKHFLAMFTCYSSIHAFFFRSQITKSDKIYLLNFTFGIFILVNAMISVISLKLGFNTTDNTELSKSVLPLVVFLFKYFSAMLTCYFSIDAFFFRYQINKSVNTYLLNFTFGIFTLVYLSGGSWAYCCLPIYTVTTLYNLFLIIYDIEDFASDLKYKWKLVIHVGYTVSATIFAVFLALGLTDSDTVASGIAFMIYAFWLYELECKRSGESLPSTDPEHDQNLTIFDGNTNNNYKIKKSIEFAGGLLGTIVFQNFFRLNSFKEVVAFLYFAVAWLADVTLLSPSHDLGVFNFLLGNAIVGCSVSEFGLGGNTWIAYAAAVFLYCLRLKIQSLSFVNGGGNCKVILW